MKQINFYAFFIFCLIILTNILIQSCDSGTNPADIDYVLPEKNLSYYDDLQPMFNGKCAFESGCHGTNTKFSLSFDTKDEFMNYRFTQTGEKLVDVVRDLPEPELSPLYLIVTEGYFSYKEIKRMPLDRNRLPQNNTDGIKQWIKEGAKD
ncbi:MAG: hypothetical protein AB7T22_00415 [Calditrichaceae bacterium]